MPECVWCVHDDDDDGGEEEELERMYFNFLIRMYKMKMRKPALNVLILCICWREFCVVTTYDLLRAPAKHDIVHRTYYNQLCASEKLFATMTNNGTKRSF